MTFDPTITVVDELATWLNTVALDDITDTNRHDALQRLRHIVGRRIFIARQPDRDTAPTLVLTTTGRRVVYGINGLVDLIETTIEAQIVARTEDGHRVVLAAQDCLLWALSSYEGAIGRITVRQIEQERDQVFCTPPRDQSTTWEHESTADYVIQHKDHTH